MITQNILFTCPILSMELKTKALVVLLAIILGSLVAFAGWLLLISRLITLAEGKKSVKHYLLWGFVVPYLNLLWVPWVLITCNGLVTKIQDKYIRINALQHAAGVQILSVPLLILYLFWTVLGIILWKLMPSQIEHYDYLLYFGTIVISVLIVFSFYLVYLALFVNRFRGLQAKHKAIHLK